MISLSVIHCFISAQFHISPCIIMIMPIIVAERQNAKKEKEGIFNQH